MTTLKKLKNKVIENLEWNVFRYNINSRSIVIYNIFDNISFFEDVENIFKNKEFLDFGTFSNKLNSAAQYTFWCRCEYEISMSGLSENDKQFKKDVYDQLLLNWDSFATYVYNKYHSWYFEEK